jgi:hypothetical protein
MEQMAAILRLALLLLTVVVVAHEMVVGQLLMEIMVVLAVAVVGTIVAELVALVIPLQLRHHKEIMVALDGLLLVFLMLLAAAVARAQMDKMLQPPIRQVVAVQV